jgi:hypothetical protein
MVVETIPQDILAIAFLLFVTLFMWLGHSKKILLLELAALCMILVGAAWAFTSVYWLIPMLFLLGNIIIFVLDVAEGR